MEEIKLYDFEKIEKFSIENIKYLLQMSEEFCKTSNRQIAYETKNENLRISTDKASQGTYSEFIEVINKDNVVVEYNINPVVENLTLFIDKEVVLSLVDLLLGGTGVLEKVDRELTNIDLELFKYLVSNLLKRIYIPYEYKNVEVVKMYTNIVQYQQLKNKDIVFESIMNVSLQNTYIGKMRFCIPYKSVDPVVNDLVNNKIRAVNGIDSNSAEDIFHKEILGFMKNVEVNICARIGTAKVSISELLNLEEGDVLLLNEKISDPIVVSIGEAEVYKAKAGLLGIKKGIQITDIVNKER